MRNQSFSKKDSAEKNFDGLTSAAEVLFAEWVDFENVVITEKETPETLLLKKTFLQSLTKEARIMAEIIIGLPEEMFLENGKLRKNLLRRIVKEQTGWPVSKIERVKERLGENLVGGCHG
jgi:hypothetical protein